MEDIKIVAVVKFNQGEAYVLNRQPEFVYEKSGNILHAQDGPFHSVYKYSTPSKTFKAFGGRKFHLPMKDGSCTFCEGQWWDGGQQIVAERLGIKFIHATIGTEKSLIECYVFSGCSLDSACIDELRNSYNGPIYEYRDYEKIVRFDSVRSNLWAKNLELQKANDKLACIIVKERTAYRKKVKGLISEVKRRTHQLKMLIK